MFFLFTVLCFFFFVIRVKGADVNLYLLKATWLDLTINWVNVMAQKARHCKTNRSERGRLWSADTRSVCATHTHTHTHTHETAAHAHQLSCFRSHGPAADARTCCDGDAPRRARGRSSSGAGGRPHTTHRTPRKARTDGWLQRRSTPTLAFEPVRVDDWGV